jgi:hypothetical protein
MRSLTIVLLLIIGFNLQGQDYLSISQKESFISASSKLNSFGFELKHDLKENGYRIFWRANPYKLVTEVAILHNLDNLRGTSNLYGNELYIFIIILEGANKDVIYDNINNAMVAKFGNPRRYKKDEYAYFLDDISLENEKTQPYGIRINLPNPLLSSLSHFNTKSDIDVIIKEKLLTDDSNFQRAFNYLKEKKYEDAIKFFTASINILDNVMMSYMLRGWTKALLEDKYGSMNDLDRAFELMKNVDKKESGDLYYYKGIVHIIMRNEKDKGCLCLSKAGELGYKDAYKAIKDLCK